MGCSINVHIGRLPISLALIGIVEPINGSILNLEDIRLVGISNVLIAFIRIRGSSRLNHMRSCRLANPTEHERRQDSGV